jgi:HK97 family phage portal protein
MPPGGIVGISVVNAARNAIGVGLAAERYGAQWFADGAHPSSVLKSEKDRISEEDAKIVKHRFLASIRGREPVVLGMGLDYQPVQYDPDKSQLHQTQKFVVEEIARFFRVPPEAIGAGVSGSSITYANREQRAIDFIQFCLRPWVVRLEEPWSSLLPRGQYVRFDFDDLLRTDLYMRSHAHLLGVRGGWLSPDDVRADDHMPPLPDGKGQNYLWPPYAINEQLTQPVEAPPDPGAPPAGAQ